MSAFNEKKGKPSELYCFTVISADNIDFLHSNARVFGGSQVSSWHGTTVQAVQPLPFLSTIKENLELQVYNSTDEYPLHPSGWGITI